MINRLLASIEEQVSKTIQNAVDTASYEPESVQKISLGKAEAEAYRTGYESCIKILHELIEQQKKEALIKLQQKAETDPEIAELLKFIS